MKSVLFIVIPCYNEEAVIEETSKRLNEKMHQLISNNLIHENSKVLFVNDGSKDKTWSLIQQIHSTNPLFTGVQLAHNKGHQNALLAGLMVAKEYADVVISMDADLQDDVNVIEDMIRKYLEGDEIVYGVRSSRKKDTFFKRFTAESFYRVMSVCGVETVFNHADYRLTSKRVLESLSEFSEVNLFLRGIFPIMGYQSSIVEYERNERFAGESKYPLKKMISFAWEGITSFTVTPLKAISVMGIIVSLGSIIALIYSLFSKLGGVTVPGWTSIMCSIWLVGGLQLFCLGTIGEYIGKIYQEVKRRPRYIIADNLLEENK